MLLSASILDELPSVDEIPLSVVSIEVFGLDESVDDSEVEEISVVSGNITNNKFSNYYKKIPKMRMKIEDELPVSVVGSLLDSDELETSSVVASLDGLVPSDPATVLETLSVSDEAFVLASVLPPSLDAELSVDASVADEPAADESVADSEAPVESLESVDCDDESLGETLDSVEPLPSKSPDPSYVDAAKKIHFD